MRIPRCSGLAFLTCALLSAACSGRLTVLSGTPEGGSGDGSGAGAGSGGANGGSGGSGASGGSTGSGGVTSGSGGNTTTTGSGGSGPGGTGGASGGSGGAGAAGSGGSGGGITTDSGSGTCGCVTGHIGWGMDGGFVPYHDTSALEVCNLFVHQRTPVAPDFPVLFCEQQITECAGVIGPGDVTRAVAHADVRAAIAAAPVLYGEDTRPGDGQVLRIQLGSAIVEVGEPCKLDGCKPIPAGVGALATLLRSITKQELTRSPCSTTFSPPGGSDAAPGSDAVCSPEPISTKVVGLDLYVLADSSSSMDCPLGVPSAGCEGFDAGSTTNTRWTALVQAINQAASALAGNAGSLGLGFAPQRVPTNVSCLAADYTLPAVPLPGTTDAVTKMLDQQLRAGASLLAIPLEGAHTYVRGYARNDPGRRTAVASVFDGASANVPCADDLLARAEKAAADAYSTIPSVPTSVIGIGLNQPELDKVASAGGTTKATLVDPASSAADVTAALTKALRTAGTPREFAIPDRSGTPGGFMKNSLNIRLNLASVGQTLDLFNVGTPNRCEDPWDPPAQQGGWFYDNETTPAKVVLCPSTVATMSAHLAVTVDFLFGCGTRFKPPPN